MKIRTGSEPAYFGHDNWKQFAPGLKEVEDALVLRHRLLDAFERAETVEDADGAPALAQLCRNRRPPNRPAVVELAGDFLGDWVVIRRICFHTVY